MKCDTLFIIVVKKMRIFVVIWLVAILAACQHQGIQETGYEHIYIHPEKAEPVQFKQLFKNYRIVPLETNDSMLVNAIYNVLVYEDRIFLLDRQNQSVLIFSDKGQARALIHNQGNGPQEYVSLFSFALNPFDRSLHLFDDQARKEHVYDWDGHWQSVRPAPYKVTDVLYLDHDRNIKSRLITDIAGGYIMNCYQQDTVVTAQYHPFEYENGATVDYLEYPFSHDGEEIYTHIVFNDTIYRYRFDQPMGGYVVHLDHPIPQELRELPQRTRCESVYLYLRDHQQTAHSAYLCQVSSQSQCISYIYGKESHFYIQRKGEPEALQYKGPYLGKLCIQDILYGSIAHNGLFCYIIEPYKYHELSDGDKQEIRSVDPELSKILDDTSTDANPVLLIGTLQ